MSERIREEWLAWEQLYWLDKKKYPRNDQCYEAGYQAATSDAKALVGELVEQLRLSNGIVRNVELGLRSDNVSYFEHINVKDIRFFNEATLAKATAWLEGK